MDLDSDWKCCKKILIKCKQYEIFAHLALVLDPDCRFDSSDLYQKLHISDWRLYFVHYLIYAVYCEKKSSKWIQEDKSILANGGLSQQIKSFDGFVHTNLGRIFDERPNE